MTISRDELSQLFDGFLDKLEQWGDDPAQVEEIAREVEPHIVNKTEEIPAKFEERGLSRQMEPHIVNEVEENPAKVEEIARQVEPHIVNEAEETPAGLSQKLMSILRELHEVESDMDTSRTPPPPPALEQDVKSADAVLIELLNESRRVAQAANDSDDDDHNEYEGEDQSTKSQASVITMSNPPTAEELQNDNGNVSIPFISSMSLTLLSVNYKFCVDKFSYH